MVTCWCARWCLSQRGRWGWCWRVCRIRWLTRCLPANQATTTWPVIVAAATSARVAFAYFVWMHRLAEIRSVVTAVFVTLACKIGHIAELGGRCPCWIGSRYTGWRGSRCICWGVSRCVSWCSGRSRRWCAIDWWWWTVGMLLVMARWLLCRMMTSIWFARHWWLRAVWLGWCLRWCRSLARCRSGSRRVSRVRWRAHSLPTD